MAAHREGGAPFVLVSFNFSFSFVALRVDIARSREHTAHCGRIPRSSAFCESPCAVRCVCRRGVRTVQHRVVTMRGTYVVSIASTRSNDLDTPRGITPCQPLSPSALLSMSVSWAGGSWAVFLCLLRCTSHLQLTLSLASLCSSCLPSPLPPSTSPSSARASAVRSPDSELRCCVESNRSSLLGGAAAYFAHETLGPDTRITVFEKCAAIPGLPVHTH